MLTQERLKQLLDYSPETGLFYWRVNRGPARIGAQAGSISKHLGYVEIRVDLKPYYGHRLAWFWMTGAWPENEIDHRDLNKANNSWINLRAASSSQNKANRSSQGKFLKGVSLHRESGLFRATAGKNGHRIHIGYFKTPAEAHAAYIETAQQLHDEFARAS